MKWWYPSTCGAEESVNGSEVSLFEGLNCTQELSLGKEMCPYWRGVLRGVLGEGFHCIAESNRMQAKDLAFVIGI